MKLPDKVNFVLIHRNISRAQLARDLGISTTALRAWLTDETKKPHRIGAVWRLDEQVKQIQKEQEEQNER